MKKVESASGPAPTFWRHLTNMARPRRSRLKQEIAWREYEDDDEDFNYAQSPKMNLEDLNAVNHEAEKAERARAWANMFEVEETGEPLIRPADSASDSNAPGMLVDRKV